MFFARGHATPLIVFILTSNQIVNECGGVALTFAINKAKYQLNFSCSSSSAFDRFVKLLSRPYSMNAEKISALHSLNLTLCT